MPAIQTTMQLVDNVTPVLNTISQALATTTAHFEALQRVSNNGIMLGNVQNTMQDFSNIAAAIYTTEQLFEQARITMETPIQPTIVPPTIPPMPTISPNNSGGNPANPFAPVPTIPPTLPTLPIPTMPTPAWQGSNNMEIFNTSGLERFNQELTSAQAMANRLASTQASIAINSANARMFPPNMGSDMDAAYRRVLRISQEMERLSHQRVGAADAGQLNNTIETLRRHLNSAVTEQNALNSAIQSMDLNSANTAYQRLVNHIDSAEVHIRDNINSQNSFNQSINQGANNASNLMNKIKGMVGAYLGLAGAKTLISNTTGAAMDLSRQMQTLNTMFGNEAVGTTYFKQLQQYALDTGQSISDLTASTRRYIGYTKNTDKLMEFNKIAQKMAVYDPAQGVQGAAYALNEALSGSFTSLKLRFEMSSADIKPLKEAVKAGNIDEVQAALNALLDAKHITDEVLEAFQNTAASKFEKLVNTFKGKMAEAGQASLQAIEPMIDRMSAWLNSSAGSAMINNISTAVFNLMNLLSQTASLVMTVGGFVKQHWGVISPIIWGVVGAMTAYKAITIAAAAAEGIKNAVSFITAAVTGTLTVAQWGLNAALLACPITWIIMVIAAVVAAILAWINHVGGLQVAFLALKNVALNVWDSICYWTTWAFVKFENGCAKMQMAMRAAGVGILNTLGDMKSFGLTIIQDFVNGAIDLINKLISNVNKITGVSINTIAPVSFGTAAQIENEVKKQTRNNNLAKFQAQKQIEIWQRDGQLTDMRIQMENRAAQRQSQLDALKAEKNTENFKKQEEPYANLDEWNKLQTDTLAPIEENTKGTKNNTDGLKDELEDNLEYLRDLAERDVINRFTTAEIRVEMNNSNNISSELDLDGVVEALTDKLYEQMQVAAEGVYN